MRLQRLPEHISPCAMAMAGGPIIVGITARTDITGDGSIPDADTTAPADMDITGVLFITAAHSAIVDFGIAVLKMGVAAR